MKSIKHNFGCCSVGIIEEGDLPGTPLRWHDIHTKFHEDWFGHSGNIITSTILDAVKLVLLLRGIIKCRTCDIRTRKKNSFLDISSTDS
jgi:hypothetical protein